MLLTNTHHSTSSNTDCITTPSLTTRREDKVSAKCHTATRAHVQIVQNSKPIRITPRLTHTYTNQEGKSVTKQKDHRTKPTATNLFPHCIPRPLPLLPLLPTEALKLPLPLPCPPSLPPPAPPTSAPTTTCPALLLLSCGRGRPIEPELALR